MIGKEKIMAEHLIDKKKNPFVALFIPNSDDTKGAFVRKIIVLIALVVAIICGLFILTDFASQKADDKMNEEIRDIVDLNASGTFSIDQSKVDEIREEQPKILDKFIDLYAQNKDLVGWIKVGHYIDYPVLMREGLENQDYYLYRDFNEVYTEKGPGSIFCDNHIIPYSDANNLVIYGHNMASGKRFATLTFYNPYSTRADGFIDYYKKYPTLQFDTLYEEGTYKIFAGIFINTEEKDGYPYPYYRKRQFKSEYEFMDFMGNIMDRSTFYTGVDVEYGDQIITLSTCYWYPTGNDVDTRFALFARKVRDGESPEVDVDQIKVNPSPLFFDEYYRRVGGSWAGRNWDLSLVKDFDKYSDKIDSLDEKEPVTVG